MASPHSERRQHPRIPVKLDVHLQLLVPEQTFTPQNIPALAVDMSLSGMKVMTQHCPEPLHGQVLKTIRHAKVDAVLPGMDKPTDFRGRIVWVSYDNQQQPPLLTLGICFDSTTQEQQTALQRGLEAFRKGSVQNVKPAATIRRPPASSDSN